MKEGDIVKAILEYVNSLAGYKVWRNQSGKVKVRGGWMQLSPTGTPDIVGYTNTGQFLGIEVKQEGKNPTKEQEAFRQACNGLSFIARSIEDVKKEITKA